MTVIRESRGPRLEALRSRAAGEGGEAFAEQLGNLIDSYRATVESVAAGDWPQWSAPGKAREQARRIMQSAVEVLAAYGEAPEAMQARLRHYLREQGSDAHGFDTGGASCRALGELIAAAATIYREQPPKNRRDTNREGFLHALREHFAAHSVPWSSTVDEYGHVSLAVDAIALAFEATPAAASKAMQRMDKDDAKTA